MENFITRHCGHVTTEMREKLLNQKSSVLWFTGLSGAGKSTIAYKLELELFSRGILTYVLDGDNIRHGLNKGLGFSQEDRRENIRRVAEVATLFSNAGVLVIVSFISPFIEDRLMARGIISDDKFIEIFIKASLDTCEKRDPKGIYKKARSGIIPEFTGISSPYEEPLSPELAVNTEKNSVSESVDYIINYLKSKKII